MTFVYRPRSPEQMEARIGLDNDDDGPAYEWPEVRIRYPRPRGSSYKAPERDEGIPRGNSDAAIGFLETLRPGGPWQLLAIAPDPVIDPQTGRKVFPEVGEFTQPDRARRFIEKWQGGRNLYFSVNRTKPCLGKKAANSEITDLLTLHAEIDPPKTPGIDLGKVQDDIEDRLKGYDPPPSLIIFSGGGYWGFWLLREPVPLRDEDHAEELGLYNLALTTALGGDTDCKDISRIARLPGTINLPNKVKRNAGRVAALATVVMFEPERRYALADFTLAPAADGKKRERRTGTGKSKSPRDSGNGTASRPYVSPDLLEIIRLGRDPHNPLRWLKADGETFDRSRAVHYVAHQLARSGWTRAEIAEVLLDRRNRISDHLYDQADPERAVWGEDRVLDKAFKALDDDTAKPDDDEPPDDIPQLRDVTQYAMPPPRQFLYGTEFCRKFLSVLIGIGKVGKTSLRIAQGMSVAIGRDLFSRDSVHIRTARALHNL